MIYIIQVQDPTFLLKYDRFHAHCHTQGVERAVKDVSFACRNAVTADDRDGFIRQAKRARKIQPNMKTKADFHYI